MINIASYTGIIGFFKKKLFSRTSYFQFFKWILLLFVQMLKKSMQQFNDNITYIFISYQTIKKNAQ